MSGSSASTPGTTPPTDGGVSEAPNPLNMSDEDFLKAPAPGSTAPVEEEEPKPTEEEVLTDPPKPEDGKQGNQTPQPGPTTGTTPPKEEPKGDTVSGAQGSVPPGSKPEESKPQGQAQTPTTGTEKPVEQPAEEPDYKGAYEKIMAPFKAMGKQMQVKSPEEAIQLMQAGAHYTKKMQEFAPQRKVVMMLQNHGLLDEGKLSYLIDIHNKNPEALKKLIKESGLDPLDLDLKEESKYQPVSHQVSDEEANFRTTLEDIASSETGKKTLEVINRDWDQASKDVLWKQPAIMQVMDEQRANGIYDRIAAEIDRQRTLGQIPIGTPFLQAYKAVGDEMVKANAFADLVPPNASNPAQPPASQAAAPAPTPVATRTATPKPEVTNSGKAAAAASTRSSPGAARVAVNPLAMSDDEFMKQMPR